VRKEEQNTIYKKGESVVCIINSRANLTIGKEYPIIEIYGHSTTDNLDVWENFGDELTLVINNDLGQPTWYDHMRFVPKNEFRKHIIDDILRK